LSGDAATELIATGKAAFGDAFNAVLGTTAALLIATALAVLSRNRGTPRAAHAGGSARSLS
jgi:hypothetical protein